MIGGLVGFVVRIQFLRDRVIFVPVESPAAAAASERAPMKHLHDGVDHPAAH
jgi:hypothetical protein